LGETSRALDYYNQALPLFRAIGDREGEATTLISIGAIYSDLGETSRALDYYNQALPLTRAVGDRKGEATTLTNIGKVYSDLGEKSRALDYYNQALPLFRAIGNRGGEAGTLNNIGRVYDTLGKKSQALEYYNQALPLLRAVGDIQEEANTLRNAAWVQRDEEQLTAALENIQSAIALIEQLRSLTPPGELRQTYFATVQDYYQFYLDLLMELHEQDLSKGYDAQAFQVSESSRARTLVEQLAEANLDIRQGVAPELLQREQTLTQQLTATEQRRITLTKGGTASQAEIDAIKAEIQKILQDLQTIEAQIRSQSPAYAQLKFPEPLTLQQVQDQILDEKTLLLEYALGEERSFLFVVSKTDLQTIELPPQAEIEIAVDAYREKLLDPTFTDLSAGDELSELLLGTIPEENPGKRLLIVSNGKLQLLPFSALPLPLSPPEVPGDVVPTVPLIAHHDIINLPSATSLAIQRQTWANRPPAPRAIAVIADPVFEAHDDRFARNANPVELGNQDLSEMLGIRAGCLDFSSLPNTAIEAERILDLAPNDETFLATGFDANHATATHPDLSQYDILHLATHGCIQDNARLSNLALSNYQETGELSEKSALHLQDIYNLKLNAELVVLSACETGTGEDVAGEGIVGMTSGFMYAGAKRVLVSLWSVSDAGTADLMTEYYQAMWQEGHDPHRALREAQLTFWLSETEYRAPYYWAAFTMQGEF
jgi:CHAT domain-containing protein/Tfp pilus assembly protein PilF